MNRKRISDLLDGKRTEREKEREKTSFIVTCDGTWKTPDSHASRPFSDFRVRKRCWPEISSEQFHRVVCTLNIERRAYVFKPTTSSYDTAIDVCEWRRKKNRTMY